MTTESEPAVQATETLGFFNGHTKVVAKVAFSSNGEHLISCGADKSIKAWNVATKECLRTLEGHSRGISDVTWHPRQNFVASASDDLTLGVWDTETGMRVRTMTGHTHFVYCCKFHQDGNVLASGSLDESVRFWDVRTAHCVKAIPAHSDPVTSLDFVCDGTMLASASSDGLCRQWDFGTGLCLRTLMDKNSPPVSHICFSPNGRYILESVLNHTLRLWDWRASTGRVVRRFEGHVNSLYCVPSFFVHGSCVASASEDGTVAIWNVHSKKLAKHDVNMLPSPVAQDAAMATEDGDHKDADPMAQGSAENAAPNAPPVSASKPTVRPETPIAMDIHSTSGMLVTSQLGDPEYAIRLSHLPGATA